VGGRFGDWGWGAVSSSHKYITGLNVLDLE